MSRHSKWHKVKQFKGAIDAKRSALFTKLANAITIAAREKGGDPETNFSLRLAIDRARGANMPKENIERAIKRGAGEGEGGPVESIIYEAFGPGGAALLIEAVTDNRNRAVSEIKHCLSRNNGTFGSSGSTAWQFEQKGIVRTETVLSEEQQMALIDAGADDIQTTDAGTEIIAPVAHLQEIQKAAQQAGIAIIDAGIEWVPKQTVPLSAGDEEKLSQLVESLEELDDVQAVYDNAR